ncbi:MAG: hypothetical protein LBD80_07185 [Tannerella sp.]|jgi:hypothetical protein|nr:hypothetical protein [Tannerella sp.]
MKKILFTIICLALFASENMAQYYGNINRSRNWLDDMSYDAPDLYRSYRAGSTLASIGMGITLGGLTAAVIGFATADKEKVTTSAGTQVNLSGEGGAMFAAGILFAVIGTPLWIVGSTKKGIARRAYFREFGDVPPTIPAPPVPYLKLNGHSQGMGLAFVF